MIDPALVKQLCTLSYSPCFLIFFVFVCLHFFFSFILSFFHPYFLLSFLAFLPYLHPYFFFVSGVLFLSSIKKKWFLWGARWNKDHKGEFSFAGDSVNSCTAFKVYLQGLLETNKDNNDKKNLTISCHMQLNDIFAPAVILVLVNEKRLSSYLGTIVLSELTAPAAVTITLRTRESGLVASLSRCGNLGSGNLKMVSHTFWTDVLD